MKLYQCDMCNRITNIPGAMHKISYTAPGASNYKINIIRFDNYPDCVNSFDRYLCADCAKRILKPFIDGKHEEEQE